MKTWAMVGGMRIRQVTAGLALVALGGVARADSSGHSSETRACPSAAVCPAGWACVPHRPMGGRCQKANLPPARCPSGATENGQRTAEIRVRMESHAAGRGLWPRLGRPLLVCYGDVREGVVQDDGAIILQRDRPVPAQAARLAHLLAHLVLRAPFPEDEIRASAQPCAEVAQRASDAEKEAQRIENELRQAFGLAALPFDDLEEAYAQRCRELRRR